MGQKIDPLAADVKLFGDVDDDMFASFSQQLAKARQRDDDKSLLVALTTTGGDAETGRRIAEDIRLCRELDGRALQFVGIASVYSAGITIMSAFKPGERYLTKGTELLIHERRIERTVTLTGALRSNVGVLRDELAALESGQRLEREGFEMLVAGTPLTADDVLEKVMETDWYLTAEEAVKAGLVKGVI